MKKILASIFVAFFLVLSPISAYAAATTESMMLFSTGAGSDEYAVMPLDYPSSKFSISLYAGKYNMFDESFNMGQRANSGVVNGSTLYDYYGIWYDYDNFRAGDKLALGFSIGSPDSSSPISVPDGSSLSIYLNNLMMQVIHNGSYYHLDTFSAVPYKVYADMYFTATQQYGSTHSATYHEQTVEITNFLRPSANPSVEGQNFDLDLNIPITADTSGFTGDRLYNINLRYIKIYAAYDFSQVNGNFVNKLSVGDSLQLAFFCRNFGADNLKTSRFSINYDSSSSTDSSTVNANIIQSSIANLSSYVSTQISQVKNNITQSTNTITTKIDTMANDVKTGLQNVVTSAQQNTQNIINTVTQKVDQVKETVTEVKDSILDLPNKIQEMLLGLIVPDSDTMADKYSEFSGLLEEKLGVIYQIPMMLFDFFDTIVNAATTPQSTLTLPAFRLPWIDGSQLTIWNSMEYKIIPDGLEVLSHLIRTVTSMTVVVLTFNSVKQAYERFLRS